VYECLGELARIAVEPLSVDDALRRGLAALEPLFGSCDLCDTPYVAAPGEVAVALPSLTLTLILHDPPAQLDRALLQVAATQLAAALRAAELASQHEQLAGEAETDALTSVANRRALDNALAAEWLRAARRGEPIALAMLDVDFFKEYNDRYGHAVGDSCLKQVASAIVSQVRRTGETCARFGGEEFAVVLPSLDLAAAIERAEEMRNAVAAAQIAHDGSQLRRVSVSIGVAAIVPDAQTSAERLLAEADAALYTAKRRGRNRVVAGEYESQAPAATRRFDSRHNLPNYATRLIGRERAIEEIGALLATRRAVTIAGAGGVGKTRLAVAAAFDIASRFRDGAWFVDLSGLYDGARVIDQIAATLGLRETPESTLETLVLDFVREHHLLLVLDNAEHVLDAAAACVQTMLRAAPELYVLATSRVPLDLPDETVFRAAPLPTGDAVTLLLDRGEASQAQAAPREELVKL
jgi:diguanylate cyclase (GGDEF)-like protein